MDREWAINKLIRSCDKLIIACKQADMFNDIKDSDSFVHILNWEIPEGIVKTDANSTSLIYLDLRSDWRLKQICNGSWREHWTEMIYLSEADWASMSNSLMKARHTASYISLLELNEECELQVHTLAVLNLCYEVT